MKHITRARWIRASALRVLACGSLLVLLAVSGVHAGVEELPPVDCVITPQLVVDVSSATPGLLAEVLADRSDTVEEGQVLARLESSVESAAVDLARARAEMEIDVELGEVSLAFDQRKHQRVERLYTNKAASQHTVDEAETDASLAQLRLKRAREERTLRKLDLRRAEASLQRRTVRSPASGVVIQRYKQPGEFVEEQPILRIAKLEPLRVEAIVPMDLFGTVQVGMQARIEADDGGVEAQVATVDAVDPMADPASGTFGVRLELPNPEGRIPAGLKCTVRFRTDAASLAAAPASEAGRP